MTRAEIIAEKFKEYGLTWDIESLPRRVRKKIARRGKPVVTAHLAPNDYEITCKIWRVRRGFSWRVEHPTCQHRFNSVDASLSRSISEASKIVLEQIERMIEKSARTLQGPNFTVTNARVNGIPAAIVDLSPGETVAQAMARQPKATHGTMVLVRHPDGHTDIATSGPPPAITATLSAELYCDEDDKIVVDESEIT